MSNSSNISTTNPCILYGTGCHSPTHLPSYIDTAACLCGLIKSAASFPKNGELVEMWRCIGNASDDVTSGGHGKWYNTSLPSQELSGLNEPQDWAENPPNLSQAYVLQDENGSAVYEKLGPGGSVDLVGADVNCTAVNSTVLSGEYYARGKGASNSTSTSTSSIASSTATSSSSGTTQPATTTSGTPSAAQSPSSGKRGPTPTKSLSSAASHVTLKSAFLVGMVLAPLFSLLM
ncbi:hypothetical protein MMC28_008886 [Mycoblastus sanguinarius]|nr:hypothetical protein [Mycoblastus sanguinarius]